MNQFKIENKNGLNAIIMDYGARVKELYVPDKNGVFNDIVTGYQVMEDYLGSNEKYFGATIGRYGNRIAKGKFELDGKIYDLALNNNENSLHGGVMGFHNVIWDAEPIGENAIKLTYDSPDMEEGFPGNLHVTVTYTLTDSDELKIEYVATTNKKTVINLTHHSFFNLLGDFTKTINNHILELNADAFTPVNETLIPTGRLQPVEGTPFDFRKPAVIGSRLENDDEQLKHGNGYDHNWVLNQQEGIGALNFAARVKEPISGRVMEVFTNEPGIQFYGGNFLNGSDVGKGGVPYNFRTSFCLETQHFPDSPNQPQFPSVVLNPDEEYYSICIYKFSS